MQAIKSYIENTKDTFCPSNIQNIDGKQLLFTNPNGSIDQLLNGKILQVVGDVALWDAEKIPKVEKWITDLLTLDVPHTILYGYTGRRTESRHGVNELVSNLLDKNIINNVVGMIVYPQSFDAYFNWKCTVPNTCKTIICTGPNCNFGDDMEIGDSKTDELICVEGGIQSFAQIVNVMIAHVSSQSSVIKSLYGCRTERGATFFSATRFIGFIKSELTLLEEDQVREKIAQYLAQYEMYDAKREDASTKDQLWYDAMGLFYENKLWKYMHLCEIESI